MLQDELGLLGFGGDGERRNDFLRKESVVFLLLSMSFWLFL